MPPRERRMTVRFFGPSDFDMAEDAESRPPAAIGYQKGVPMVLAICSKASEGQAPTFLVAALKDPLRRQP